MIISISTLIAVCKIFLCTSLFFVWVVRYDSITKEFEDYKLPEWLRDLVGILKLSFSMMILYNHNELVMIGVPRYCCAYARSDRDPLKG